MTGQFFSFPEIFHIYTKTHEKSCYFYFFHFSRYPLFFTQILRISSKMRSHYLKKYCDYDNSFFCISRNIAITTFVFLWDTSGNHMISFDKIWLGNFFHFSRYSTCTRKHMKKADIFIFFISRDTHFFLPRFCGFLPKWDNCISRNTAITTFIFLWDTLGNHMISFDKIWLGIFFHFSRYSTYTRKHMKKTVIFIFFISRDTHFLKYCDYDIHFFVRYVR